MKTIVVRKENLVDINLINMILKLKNQNSLVSYNEVLHL